MKVIVADTSCLILYDKIGQLAILTKTFPELFVTKEVADEFGKELPDQVLIREVTDKRSYLKWAENLGKGEASSITLALENEGSLLIIDEKKGRKVAETLKIEIIGSLGVLIKAKEKGVIQSVEEILKLIDQTDFRISDAIRKAILKVAGEGNP